MLMVMLMVKVVGKEELTSGSKSVRGQASYGKKGSGGASGNTSGSNSERASNGNGKNGS